MNLRALDFETEDVAAQLWRASIPGMARNLMGKHEYRRAPHLKVLNKLLDRAVFEGGVRAIVQMPPRHSKSHTVSTWGPVYCLEQKPDFKTIVACYGKDLARLFTRKGRNIAQQYAGQLRFDLAGDSKASDIWQTKQGGQVIAAGVDSATTGFGCNLLIVDDPIKNMRDAMSQTVRDAAWDWYTSTSRTRLENEHASIIICLTRWHEDDLAGRVLRQAKENPDAKQWEIYSFPAIAEENDPLGREPGEPLWPWKMSKQMLLETKADIPKRVWDALFQQRPSIESSGFFPTLEEWPKWTPGMLPQHDAEWSGMILSVDATFKDGPQNDNAALQLWGLYEQRAFLLDEWTGKAGLVKVVAQINYFLKKWPRITTLLVEDKANGPAVIEQYRQACTHLNVMSWNPQGSKEARAVACEPFFDRAAVLIPDPSTHPWVVDYVREMTSFPQGTYDDRVDATTQMLLAGLLDSGLGSSVLSLDDVYGDLYAESRAQAIRPGGESAIIARF